MAASATFALNAELCVRRARLAIVTPDLRHSRRLQAEAPLIDLSEFGQPALSGAIWRVPKSERASAGSDGVGSGCTALSGCSTAIECNTGSRKSPWQDRSISLDVKRMGERSAGNPHAAFDVAGAGNGARGEVSGRRGRASPRPYHRGSSRGLDGGATNHAGRAAALLRPGDRDGADARGGVPP